MEVAVSSFSHTRPRQAQSVQLPPKGLPLGVKLLLIAVFVLACFSADREVGIYGTAVLWFAAKMLWRPGQPQTLFFMVLFQWVQAFGPVLQSLLDGRSYADLTGFQEMETATWLSLSGVAVLALGLKLGSRRSEPKAPLRAIRGSMHLDSLRLLIAYLIVSAATLAVRIGGGMSATVIQAGSAIEVLKWAVVLLIFYRWTATGKGGLLALVLLIIESLIGMAGYFSSFKTVFFMLVIAGTGSLKLGKNRAILFVLLGIILIFFLGFWQVVKGYYRSYMNQGEKAQVINVSLADRAEWMREAVSLVGFEHIEQGWQEGLKRLSYVDFFGYAIKTVPQVVPHTNGELWAESIKHVLMPRILFPNKPAIDDSTRTNAYCGVSVSGAEEGTSISIGYMGESYIDFGVPGMFAPIFIWGCFVGWSFSWLRRRSPHPLLGVALGNGLIVLTSLLIETSNLKMVGGLLVALLGLFPFVSFFSRGIWFWLIGGSERSPALLTGRISKARSSDSSTPRF